MAHAYVDDVKPQLDNFGNPPGLTRSISINGDPILIAVHADPDDSSNIVSAFST